MLADADIFALWVTLKLAFTTTFILLIIGTPLAWFLARSKWKYLFLIEALVSLPLVLPPTVLGFYLLLVLSPKGYMGRFLEFIGGSSPAFTFSGLVIGSVIYSLPFVVQPIQGAFKSMGNRPMEVAATLRASPLDRFFSVALPIAWPSYITAAVLGFSHTLGEFGIVIMIGGNIPGSTQVLSIAIYDHVESLEYTQAHILAGGLLLFSFTVLALIYGINKRFKMVSV